MAKWPGSSRSPQTTLGYLALNPAGSLSAGYGQRVSVFRKLCCGPSKDNLRIAVPATSPPRGMSVLLFPSSLVKQGTNEITGSRRELCTHLTTEQGSAWKIRNRQWNEIRQKKNVFSLLLKNSLGNCKKIKYKNGKKNDSLKRKTEKVLVTSLRFYDVQACTLFQRDMMK